MIKNNSVGFVHIDDTPIQKTLCLKAVIIAF